MVNIDFCLDTPVQINDLSLLLYLLRILSRIYFLVISMRKVIKCISGLELGARSASGLRRSCDFESNMYNSERISVAWHCFMNHEYEGNKISYEDNFPQVSFHYLCMPL